MGRSRLMSNVRGGEQARISVSCWRMLPFWSSYMDPLSGLTPLTPRSTKQQSCFWINRRLLYGVSVFIALYPQRQIVCWRVYPDPIHVILVQGGKKCWARCDERQTILCKWKEWFSRSSKRMRIHLLIHERGHGQMDFYLTQVMSGRGPFNASLFHMRLVENPKCDNCDRRGLLFECLAFQLFWEDVVTILQETSEEPLTPVWSQSCHRAPKDRTRWPPLSLWECVTRWS